MKSLLALAVIASIFCVVLVFHDKADQSNCPDERGQFAAISAVNLALSFQLPLVATPDPDLKDDLITLATTELTNALGAQAPDVDLYRVTPTVYTLKDHKIVGETIDVDTHRDWLVAVDSGNNGRYLLKGSQDPTAEFNRLARDLHFHVTDSRAALNVFDFFLKVAYGQQFRSQVVGDDMQLESLALADFNRRFPPAKRRAAFTSWWVGVSPAKKMALAAPAAKPLKDGFEVRYFFYTEGGLSIRELTVNRDGTIAGAKSTAM